MPSDEGGKVLIHEWKQHRFYINRVDHGTAHVHIYEHNRIICEYDLETLELRKGHPTEKLHNYVQGWGYRNLEENMAKWRAITGDPPHASNPIPPMSGKRRQLRRRKRKR